MLAAAIAAFLLFTAPAAAQVTGPLGPSSPVLKRKVLVSSDIVRMGDLIENAGAQADLPLFRAPDLGSSGAVSAARVIGEARSHNLLGVDSGGVTEVVVTRASRVLTVKDVEERIARAIAAQGGRRNANDLSVRLEREWRDLHVEPTIAEPLQLLRLAYEPRSGYFDAAFELLGNGSGRRVPVRLSGYAVETVETAVLTRALERGEIVRASDVSVQRRPKAESIGDSLGNPEAAIGLAARRAMRASQTLRQADLIRPELVRRNETVTLIFEAPGITLTMRGKALEAGGEGDFISVLNVQSKRTIQGTVTAPGTVFVSAIKPRIVSYGGGGRADLAMVPNPEAE